MASPPRRLPCADVSNQVGRPLALRILLGVVAVVGAMLLLACSALMISGGAYGLAVGFTSGIGVVCALIYWVVGRNDRWRGALAATAALAVLDFVGIPVALSLLPPVTVVVSR